MAKDKVAPPTFPELEAALRDLVTRGMTRVDEIQRNLPEGMQVSAGQIRGILDEILGHANWASIRDMAVADVYSLLVTGRSEVKHDPVNLA